MSFKRHNFRTEAKDDGIYHLSELFVHDTDNATYAPVVGTQINWVPGTVSYVIDFKEKPHGPHMAYEIIAKDETKLASMLAALPVPVYDAYHDFHRVEKQEGLYYHIKLFVIDENRPTKAPVVGAVAPWAPTDATVMDFKANQIGDYWDYEIVAKDVEKVTVHTDHRGEWYEKIFYVDDADMATYRAMRWTNMTWYFNNGAQVLDIEGNPPYCYQIESRRLGYGSNLVTLKAAEPKFCSTVTGGKMWW
jgi:hypothetical protein